MIRKIVSGGQTGADQAALDAAISLGVPHGGWIPKGRKTESGMLPESYQLKEMPTSGYAERTEKNVVDSEGTVILSHGKLAGGSLYTRKMAIKHSRPWIHLNLNQTNEFNAAMILSKWIRGNSIDVLNVAGPRASNDPGIYKATAGIIESAYFLLQIGDNAPGSLKPPSVETPVPKTVADAVSRLTARLPLKDRTTIANMTVGEIGSLRGTLGEYVRNAFGIGSGNEELMASCRFVQKKEVDGEDDAVMVIIRSLWKKLRVTHRLRVVQ